MSKKTAHREKRKKGKAILPRSFQNKKEKEKERERQRERGKKKKKKKLHHHLLVVEKTFQLTGIKQTE